MNGSSSRSTTPNRRSSRPGSPNRVETPTGNRPGSPKGPWSPAGKPVYSDQYLLYDEDIFKRRPASPASSSKPVTPKYFGNDETGVPEEGLVEGKDSDGPAPFKITAWDESWEKEAERLIKVLRLTLKETRDKVEKLKEEKRELVQQNEAMQELFLERRQVAEDALMALEKLKMSKGTENPMEDNSMSKAEGGSEGRASWRDDRARLGARVAELEAIESQLNTTLAEKEMESSTRIAELEAQLSASEEKGEKYRNTIVGLEGSVATLSKSLDDENATVVTLQTEIGGKRKRHSR